MELTRFDLKRQATQERIATALERIAAALESSDKASTMAKFRFKVGTRVRPAVGSADYFGPRVKSDAVGTIVGRSNDEVHVVFVQWDGADFESIVIEKYLEKSKED